MRKRRALDILLYSASCIFYNCLTSSRFFCVCFEHKNRRDSVDRSPPRDGRPAAFLSTLEQLPEQHHHSVRESEGRRGLHRRNASMRRQEPKGPPGSTVRVQPIFSGTVKSEYNLQASNGKY